MCKFQIDPNCEFDKDRQLVLMAETMNLVGQGCQLKDY